MFKETGFVGNSSDAERVPLPLPPRRSVEDTAAPSPFAGGGGLAIVATQATVMVDSVSILPATVPLLR